jgi:hypothetical protein
MTRHEIGAHEKAMLVIDLGDSVPETLDVKISLDKVTNGRRCGGEDNKKSAQTKRPSVNGIANNPAPSVNFGSGDQCSNQQVSGTIKTAGLKQDEEGLHIPYSLFPKVDWVGARLKYAVDDCEFDVQQQSPLVLDFSGAETLVTQSIFASPVKGFDFAADGTHAQAGWLASNTAGFLALDLNSNGLIDNGRELFGDSTLLQSTNKTAANGYLALEQYAPRANEINRVTPIFSKLLVWFDRNGDAISQAEEIVSLATTGVTSLQLNYNESIQRTTVTESNDVRYEARFFGPQSCGAKGCKSYDVFFGSASSVTQK